MEVARRLGECRRPTDIIARMGGDEFTILLDGIKEVSDATRVANRIQKKLAAPYNLSGNEVFTSASIGIALSATGYDRPEDLLRDADIAMYRAKKLGKVRYQIFDRSMHARAVALLQLESDLRRAVAREEFRVHYQPIVSSETGEISALEALVRWQHPERGLIPPAEFIALAEDTGMIVPLGLWVLREACRQMREWQTRFPDRAHLAISANLSIKQFSQPDLVAQIDNILQETHLSADDLKLEITESVIMENDRSAASTLSRLRDMGIHLCTDDFGTGYSSLSYLHRFPIDTLKIDRSFVSRMGVDGKDTEIVGAIITMAHGLDIEVVAEGVETAEQLTHLRRLQCEQGQGYYFSKPLDSQSLETLLSREPQWRNGSEH
jgi:EAL domain-containing protein (putative c-di-GMP-specific phosphodiesterase class I)